MWRRRKPVRLRLEGALGAVARTRVGEVEAVVEEPAVAVVVVVEVEAVEAEAVAVVEVEAVAEEPAVAVGEEEEVAVGAGPNSRVAPRADRSQRSESIVPRPRPSCPRSLPHSP
jgi:hypothetical protein